MKMSEQRKRPEGGDSQKERTRKSVTLLAVCMAGGMVLGVGLGSMLGNTAMGISLGTTLGVGFGGVLAALIYWGDL